MVTLLWCVTVFAVVLIIAITALLMDHSNVRIYREYGYLNDPEHDSYLERWHLARKTR